jgi:hypothetical protein
VVLAITLPLTGLWYLRNHHEFDTWTFTSSEAITLYWYRAGGLVAEQEDIAWDPDARRLLTLRLNPGMSEIVADEIRHGAVPPDEQGNEGQYYERARAEAIEILAGDPVGTARQALRGVYSQAVSSGWGTAAGVYGIDLPGPVDRLGVAVNLAIEALAAVGAIVALRRKGSRRAHVLVLVLLAYTLAINAGYQATAGHRFRAVLLPIIALYAAVGAQHLHDAWRRRRAAPDPTSATG